MSKLVLICLVGIMLCMAILTKDIVSYIKTRKMVKRTISNCFRILKEKEMK